MLPRLFLSCALLTGTFLSQAKADQRFIIRTTHGLAAIQALCGLASCDLIQGLGDPQSQLFMISTPNTFNINLLLPLSPNLGIVDIEIDIPINVLGPPIAAASGPPPSGLLDSAPVSYFGTTVWDGYANQPAANVVRVQQAQEAFDVQGAGIVAVIDTGVDPHPALANVLVPGYDFTKNDSSTTSETAGLDQSTAAVVDGSPTPVGGSMIAVLDPSQAALISGPDYAAFGHGTMVAGIVHLVAPRAFIMPLKAFEANGEGYLSEILRAIYWAVANDARVLNMSFSTPSYSQEFQTALNYATSQKFISIAAAGNNGNQAIVYPAGFQNDVMGVASTNMADQRSNFSNYGPQDVWVAAPGEGIISTYPFDTYAAGWGTSFSAPFVTGSAALILNLQYTTDESNASAAIANAKRLNPSLVNGELDVYQALSALQSQR